MRHTNPRERRIRSGSLRGKNLMLRKVTIGIVGFLSMPIFAMAISLAPAGPEASGYLNTNPVGVTPSFDGYLEVSSPSETCRVHEGDPGWTWGTSYIGDLGNGQSLASYLTACSQPITDWTVDGDWYVRIYDNMAFDTILEGVVFCQGSGCATPPPPTPSTSTTTAQYPDLPFQATIIFFLTFWTIMYILGAWKS